MSRAADEFYDTIVIASTRNSDVCKFRGKMRDRAAKCIMAVWPATAADQDELPISKDDLMAQAKAKYKQVYGNPLFIYFLTIIIQVLAEMLLEWWRNRQQMRGAFLECATICRNADELDKCFANRS